MVFVKQKQRHRHGELWIPRGIGERWEELGDGEERILKEKYL